MAEDVLNLVKSAELDAQGLVDKAKKEADTIIKDSTATAEDSYKTIVEEAKSKANSILEDAQNSARANKKPIISKAEEEALLIKKQEEPKINQIIESLIGRIVENGNS